MFLILFMVMGQFEEPIVELFHFNLQQQRQRKEKQIKSVMDFSFPFHQAEVFHQI